MQLEYEYSWIRVFFWYAGRMETTIEIRNTLRFLLVGRNIFSEVHGLSTDHFMLPSKFLLQLIVLQPKRL